MVLSSKPRSYILRLSLPEEEGLVFGGHLRESVATSEQEKAMESNTAPEGGTKGAQFDRDTVHPDYRDTLYRQLQENLKKEGEGLGGQDDVHLALNLIHYTSAKAQKREVRKSVLLLHNGSASSRVFLTPANESKSGNRRNWENFVVYESDSSLVSWLLFEAGCDVWLLDWRSSFLVTDHFYARYPERKVERYKALFNLDQAATVDVPRALATMARELSREGEETHEVYVVGQCLGSAVLAIAIANGVLARFNNTMKDRNLSVEGVGHGTIGLFYDVHFDGHLKTQDFLLERIRSRIAMIDPRTENCPNDLFHLDDLDRVYKNWRNMWATHWSSKAGQWDTLSSNDAFCNRLSFLYGLTFKENNLETGVHDVLEEHFGGMPIDILIHSVRNIRTGWAGPFLSGTSMAEVDQREGHYLSENARAHYQDLARVLLLTGKDNRLWHRSSIDSMYEWLMRGSINRTKSVRKEIKTGYGHQDLLWGPNSKNDVFGSFKWLLGIENEN